MVEAYGRIFARCGLEVIVCEAESGAMGGEGSSEFMAPAERGEDVVVRCAACGYAANREAARCPAIDHGAEPPRTPPAPKEVATPGRHTVEQVSQFLSVPPTSLIKTLVYETGAGTLAALVRGDHEVNEAKLARAAGATRVTMASAATIARLTGAPVGFTGPVGLRADRMVADQAVMAVSQGVAGANKADAHLVGVVPGRDFQPDLVADIRMAIEGDVCPRCRSALSFVSAIEVGHVFKLGTKYSEALGATVQDARGREMPMVMGCYGVGVNRILAAAIEQRHDEAGIIWPGSIAPFEVIVTVLEASDAALKGCAEQAAEQLSTAGLTVLLDDREQSPGSKLKDADLIGIPVQVIVGKVWQAEGRLEVVARASKDRERVSLAQLPETAKRWLDKS